MEYYCEICDNYNKPKNKYKLFISNIHKKCDKCKHTILSLKDIVINDVDRAFYLYKFEHKAKLIYYPVKCQFKIVLNDC